MTTALASPDSRPVAANGPPHDPLAMLAAALQSGHDPAKLEKLMDLADRWRVQQAEAAFNAAMNAAQAEMPCVVKDRENTFTKSRYATLETVMAAIKPVYTRHGFSLMYAEEDSPLADHVRIVCHVKHVAGHTVRTMLNMPIDSAGMKGGSNKSGAQAMGSTVSYGRRYLALMIFNVTVANEDIDGNAADALDTITEAEALQVEDLLIDSKADRDRFLEWADKAGHLTPGGRAVGNIRKKRLAAVLDTLSRKKKEAGAK